MSLVITPALGTCFVAVISVRVSVQCSQRPSVDDVKPTQTNPSGQDRSHCAAPTTNHARRRPSTCGDMCPSRQTDKTSETLPAYLLCILFLFVFRLLYHRSTCGRVASLIANAIETLQPVIPKKLLTSYLLTSSARVFRIAQRSE
jgi:uncharacterized paraquat-inducible protein A